MKVSLLDALSCRVEKLSCQNSSRLYQHTPARLAKYIATQPYGTYLQYFDGQTGFLKIAYSDKINAPPLHISREMGTASYDV